MYRLHCEVYKPQNILRFSGVSRLLGGITDLLVEAGMKMTGK